MLQEVLAAEPSLAAAAVRESGSRAGGFDQMLAEDLHDTGGGRAQGTTRVVDPGQAAGHVWSV